MVHDPDGAVPGAVDWRGDSVRGTVPVIGCEWNTAALWLTVLAYAVAPEIM